MYIRIHSKIINLANISHIIKSTNKKCIHVCYPVENDEGSCMSVDLDFDDYIARDEAFDKISKLLDAKKITTTNV